jgi:hypothetical protein
VQIAQAAALTGLASVVWGGGIYPPVCAVARNGAARPARACRGHTCRRVRTLRTATRPASRAVGAIALAVESQWQQLRLQVLLMVRGAVVLVASRNEEQACCRNGIWL